MSLCHPRWKLITAVCAVFLWLMTVGGVVADVLYPAVPDPIINTLGIAAGMATLATVVLRSGRLTRTASVERVEPLTVDFGRHRRVYRGRVPMAAVMHRSGALERSEYWQVYADVMRDLSGLDGHDSGGLPQG